jgi:hypothetical protein
MQVTWSKIIFQNILSRGLFGEFLEFYRKGLMPLIIQINFQDWLFPDFLLPNLWWIEVDAKRQSIHFDDFYLPKTVIIL